MVRKILVSLSIFLLLLAGAWFLNDEDDTMIFQQQNHTDSPYDIIPLTNDGNEAEAVEIFERNSPFNPREYVKFRRVIEQNQPNSLNE